MSKSWPKVSTQHYAGRRRKRRLQLVTAGVCVLACALGLIVFAMRDTASFFRVPSDITAADKALHKPLRLGGYVQTGTVERHEGTQVNFNVTDHRKTQAVRFNGILPDLFREGQGVIVEGRFDASGMFIAERVLAKHDEKYVPKDLADRLQAQGLLEEYLHSDH